MWAWNLYTAIRILQGFMAALFNLVVIICFFKFSRLRTPSNILVTCLAGTDFLHGILFVVVFPLRTFYQVWPAFKYICYWLIGPEAILVYVQFSIYSLLSIQRYHILKARIGPGSKWSRTTTLILISSCFLAVSTWVVTMSIFASDPEENSDCTAAAFYLPSYIHVGVIIFVVTTMVTFIFYCRIAYLVIKSQRQIANESMNTSQIARRTTEIRITKMMAMVVGVFFVLYSPFFIANLGLIFVPSKVTRVIFRCAILLCDISFWINPLIYAKRDKEFRNAFDKLFAKLKCKRESQPINNIPANDVPHGNACLFLQVQSNTSGTGAPTQEIQAVNSNI